MKKILIILFIIISGTIKAQKTYVMHYLPILGYEQARAYSGYDMIIVDHEVINTSADWLRYMRVINPSLKILVYAEKMQWHRPMFPDKPWSIKMLNFVSKYPNWFLLSPTGDNLTFWPKTVMMDIRPTGFRYNINGKSYNYIEFFTERYLNDIINSFKTKGIKLDGVLDDDLLKEISFLNGGVDANRDGLEDEAGELNRQWRLGNAYFLEKIRQKMGENFLIIGNGGHGYYLDWCQGKQMEHFPETYIGSWFNNMTNASGMKIALFNARTGNKSNWFFTLCSSVLLDNTWFSEGQNIPYDNKYDLKLGKPLNKVYQENGVFIRQFEYGMVHVNPETETAWIKR